MSHRPIHNKKLRRLRKALARRPLPAWIDLIDWLKLHGYAQTTGEAEKIILAKRVKSESHTLGIVKEQRTRPDGKTVEVELVQRFVPAVHKETLRVQRA